MHSTRFANRVNLNATNRRPGECADDSRCSSHSSCGRWSHWNFSTLFFLPSRMVMVNSSADEMDGAKSTTSARAQVLVTDQLDGSTLMRSLAVRTKMRLYLPRHEWALTTRNRASTSMALVSSPLEDPIRDPNIGA